MKNYEVKVRRYVAWTFEVTADSEDAAMRMATLAAEDEDWAVLADETGWSQAEVVEVEELQT